MLEQVIRPFAPPHSLATQRIVASDTQQTVTRARLQWGAAGALPSPTVEPTDLGLNFKIEECDTKLTENSRKTSKIRVENPNDPSQYVMIERINEIAFYGKPQTKIVGSIVSETTAYSDLDPFAGTPWGTVTKADKCNNTFILNNTLSPA